jgi:hypothetical protein
MLLHSQHGRGIGADAFEFLKDNKEDIAKKAYENRAKIFQTISNAQRFVSKNIKKNPNPIRYLKENEIHVMNHNFTGPGTRIDLPEVRNHAPYNGIDACSKIHDIKFNEIFKMPLGKERSEKIREADRKVLECYDKYPNDSGYRLAKLGINSKIRLEDLSPSLFDQIMGQNYRGVEPELKDEEKKDKADRKERLRQKGGLDPITGYLMVAGPLTAGALYLESVAAKKLYDLYKQKESN